MSKKFYLSLLLLPVFAHAEMACLEDPSTGRCYPTDLHAEVFKSVDNRAVARYAAPSPPTQTTEAANNTAKKQPPHKNTGQIIAEQRIMQRAKIIEERANKRQFNNR